MTNIRKFVMDMYEFSKKPVVAGREFFFSIELLRGVASVIILVVHYKNFTKGPSFLVADEDKGSLPFHENLSFILEYGSNAVQLFWVISGFVFLHVYGGKANVSAQRYSLHRFSRLYPLHLLTLLVVLITQMITHINFGEYSIYYHHDTYHFVLNLFFASEWGLQEGRSFNGPIWSVSVEIASYVLFFIVIRFWSLSPIKILIFLFSSFVVYGYTKATVVLCLYFFLLGCFCYAVHVYIKNSDNKIYIIFIVTLLFVTGIAAAAKLNFIPRMVSYGLIYMCLILFSINVDSFIPKLTLFKWLGNTSYGNYLWHSPIQMLFLLFCSLEIIPINIIYTQWFFIGYLFFVFIVSVLSYYYFEIPAKNWLNKKA